METQDSNGKCKHDMTDQAIKSRSHDAYKPRLGRLLQNLGLDTVFDQANGTQLSYVDGEGRRIQILDLVGGYGSLLLGHNHPGLVAAAQAFYANQRPMLTQGSRSEAAHKLAATLNERVGGDYVSVFGNSGAEAVEAAMKHAMLETGGNRFIALEGAFHGKTLGAVQLTANPDYREPFESGGIEVLRVPANDVDKLMDAFDGAVDLAGFVFEPIQGEGGIRPLNPEFVGLAADLCRRSRIPMIADECQTGCGRTGKFLGSETLGVQPDYVILSKSLGGGMAKISALMIERSRYDDRFDLMHSSTFAADGFSTAMACETLALIDDALMARSVTSGKRLLAGLRQLQLDYPDVIRSVRGAGLMAGVELAPMSHSSSFVLRCLTDSEDLAFIVASYLFNVHRIRVAPSLSDRRTIRMTPAAVITDRQIDQFLWAMNSVCHLLHKHDALGITRHLSAKQTGTVSALQGRADGRTCVYDASRRLSPRFVGTPVAKVAWLCHLIDAEDITKLESGFSALEATELCRLSNRLGRMAAPVLMSRVAVRSRTGLQVDLHPILLPVSSDAMKRALASGDLTGAQAMVQDGVDMAKELGCDVTSLGQYTSIVTRNGRTVDAGGMGITTGNTYAVALAVQAVLKAQHRFHGQPRRATLAVVGASGNIGSACAERLASYFGGVRLICNDTPRSIRRTSQLAKRLPGATVSTNLDAVREADAVIVAVNTVSPILGARHFKRGAVVCDLSVPLGVDADIQSTRPDLFVFKGGIAQLPGAEDLEIVGFPLEKGLTFGCMAEGLLLGFEQIKHRFYTGTVRVDGVRELERLADLHGFGLADYKRSCVLGSVSEEEIVDVVQSV
jgi:acetylornithine/succinyldiaminopimelate/putrescine aminotransferase/predicted amino acid dehydrogenase